MELANLRPLAVETTTVRSEGAMTPRSRSLISAASATPVCGQLNMPARAHRVFQGVGAARSQISATGAMPVCGQLKTPACSASAETAKERRHSFRRETRAVVWPTLGSQETSPTASCSPCIARMSACCLQPCPHPGALRQHMRECRERGAAVQGSAGCTGTAWTTTEGQGDTLRLSQSDEGERACDAGPPARTRP